MAPTAVWAPTFVLMWRSVPAHMRIPFVCSVSLVWQVVLSTTSYISAPATTAEVERAPPLEVHEMNDWQSQRHRVRPGQHQHDQEQQERAGRGLLNERHAAGRQHHRDLLDLSLDLEADLRRAMSAHVGASRDRELRGLVKQDEYVPGATEGQGMAYTVGAQI